MSAAHIGVRARFGVVTLTGVLASEIEREDVLTAVKHVYGVAAIVDELELASRHVGDRRPQ